MNGENWFWSDLDESFFDDVVDSLEGLEANNLGLEGWRTEFEALEEPLSLTDFPAVPTKNPISTSSPVSVLESFGSCSGEKHVPINPKLVFAVKRTRSKRRRPAALNPLFFRPFISPTSSNSEDYYPSTASESGSENNRTEKHAKKKQNRKKNLTVLSGSEANRRPPFQKTDTPRKCLHCEVTETPQWREGPMGPKTLCNACGVRYRSGRLVPEYRPAASPTFVAATHSNSHKRIMEMRNQGKVM